MYGRVGLIAKYQWEGGRLWIENLARCVLRVPPAERPELHWIALTEAPLHPEIAGGARVVSIASASKRLPARLSAIGERLAVPAYARWARLDAVLPSLVRVGGRARRFAWIPDFQHVHLPAMFSADARREREVTFRRTAMEADRVVLSSETVALDFAAALPDLAHKVRVLQFCTPLAPDDFASDAQANRHLEELPPRFAYLPNQLWAHKDHKTAIRAVGLLGRRGVHIPLVCTGALDDPRFPEHGRELADLVKNEGVDARFLGHIPRAVQLRVFERAAVIVQPSLFEGWSTVVEDARALARPIVLSDIPTHVEQAPPLGRFFRAGSAPEMADALAASWSAPDLHTDRAQAIVDSNANAVRVGRRLCHILLDSDEN